jgi:predicted RecB family nuclease
VVPGVGDYEAKLMLDHGISSLRELAEAELEFLTSFPGISEDAANQVKQRARELEAEKQAQAAAAAEGAAPSGS